MLFSPPLTRRSHRNQRDGGRPRGGHYTDQVGNLLMIMIVVIIMILMMIMILIMILMVMMRRRMVHLDINFVRKGLS